MIIDAHNVSKSYGSSQALDSFSLKVEKGQAYALLGPNGAGKTTFVKSLLGLVHIDQGKIEVMGKSHEDASARQKVAYLPEKFQFYSFDTAENVLYFYAQARGVEKSEQKTQVQKAMETVGITDLAKKKISKLSKGQLQRIGLASVLVGEIDLLVLDEPFSGLDPIGIKEFRDLFIALKEQGKTLFINSHTLSEMEKVCDSFAILNKGKCLAQGKASELLAGQSLENFFYQLIKAEA